jgi:hypothetical protein
VSRAASSLASGTLQKNWSQIVISSFAWQTALATPAMTVNSPRTNGGAVRSARSGMVRHICTAASPAGGQGWAGGRGRAGHGRLRMPAGW